MKHFHIGNDIYLYYDSLENLAYARLPFEGDLFLPVEEFIKYHHLREEYFPIIIRTKDYHSSSDGFYNEDYDIFSVTEKQGKELCYLLKEFQEKTNIMNFKRIW